MYACLIGMVSALLMSCALPAKNLAVSSSASQGEIRQKRLLAIDEAMNWACPLSSRSFSLVLGSKSQLFTQTINSLESFVSNHGYFSSHKPLVGIVTESLADLESLRKTFSGLMQSKDADWICLATEELICKALAYRNLQKKMKISLPTQMGKKVQLVEYEVDEVFDLWQGMPAFGLLPLEKNAHPILLFRGTDFSFVSKSSWASILSDCDFTGAGFTTFRSSEKVLQNWLKNACSIGIKPHVMGFSLGGILAIYTAIFQGAFIDRCTAFNAPGVSKAVFEMYEHLSSPPPIFLYATQGDLVSRFGKMVPKAFEMTDKSIMGPIEAHTKIMTAKNPFLLFRIDTEKENQSRFLGEEPHL